MKKNKTEYFFGWDLSDDQSDLDKALKLLSQFRQAYLKVTEGKTFAEILPDIGTDERGSDLGFDWYMLNEFESRKLLDKYNIKREKK